MFCDRNFSISRKHSNKDLYLHREKLVIPAMPTMETSSTTGATGGGASTTGVLGGIGGIGAGAFDEEANRAKNSCHRVSANEPVLINEMVRKYEAALNPFAVRESLD